MHEQNIAPYKTDSAWLITASSFLMDRVVPECERIHLPPRTVQGGVFSFGRGPLPAPPPSKRRLSDVSSWRTPDPIAAPHSDVFDLRRNTPSNWAHFLNNHLPIVFTVCDRLDVDPTGALLVMPADTPAYITGAARMMGLQVLLSDAQIKGDGILYDSEPWTGIRPARQSWLDVDVVRTALARLDKTADPNAPRRVFLSRRATRAPTNEADVTAWLTKRGFVTVYPEDLSPDQQMQLFRQAEIMVAVHGAGLAPLLYAQPNGRLTHLVEILHAGHMTDVYRVMAHQVGVNWVGVRGRLKPEYIKDAYDFGAVYKAHSLDNFEIDLTSLDIAFETAGIS